MTINNISLQLTNGLARLYGQGRRSEQKEQLSRVRKILLVNPPEASLVNEYLKPTRYPLTLFTIAAPLMQRFANIQVVIADLSLPGMNLEKILQDERPDLIGITFVTPQAKMAKEIVDKSKEILGEQVICVGGGPHISAVPIESLEDIPLDYGVLFEGEETFIELIAALDKRLDIKNVQSVCYREGNKIITTTRRARIRDLDQFPLVSDIIPTGYLDQYEAANDIEKFGIIVPMITSRGCSHTCAFCASHAVFFKEAGISTVVSQSWERVMAEIKGLYEKHNVRVIRFADDVFDLYKDRALHISKEISRLGLSIELSFQSRARKIQPTQKKSTIEYYKQLSMAGFKRVALGIESGDIELMHRMGKPQGALYGGENVALLHEAGILSKYYLLVGLPGQDWTSIEKTKTMLANDKPDFRGVAIAMPYPGSSIAHQGSIRLVGEFPTRLDMYASMLKEPPHTRRGVSFMSVTETDAMTREDIGKARETLFRF